MVTTSHHDYSESIIIPGNIPEHMEAHYAALETAKRIIHILSQFALSVNTRAYNILHGASENMVLPEQYQFERFIIRFLPGWGTYFVILEDGKEVSIKITEDKERFEADLILIKTFLNRYYKLPIIENTYREPAQNSNGWHRTAFRDLSPREKELIKFKSVLREEKRLFY